MCVSLVQFVISKVPSTIHPHRANRPPKPCSPKSLGSHGASSLQPELRGARGAAAPSLHCLPCLSLPGSYSPPADGQQGHCLLRLPRSQSDPHRPGTLALGRRPHVRLPVPGDPQPGVLASTSFQMGSPTSASLDCWWAGPRPGSRPMFCICLPCLRGSDVSCSRLQEALALHMPYYRTSNRSPSNTLSVPAMHT